MDQKSHNVLSSYREMLIEHLFTGALMRHAWLFGEHRLEVLKPQVDDGGYDLVIERGTCVRHVQLKATFKGSSVGRFTINLGLAGKPSGCVVVVVFDPNSLDLGPFLWLGGAPGEPLPDIANLRVATHTKRNVGGVKGKRPNLRVVPRARFTEVPGMGALAERLFGKDASQAAR